tara:strand:- start:3893 stop:4324 length:432 start_codon:yes stop_codon:yes gene_type:complete
MKTQSCKAKGRRLQQLIVQDLLTRFPQLAEDDVRSTSMGANGEDVLLSPTARKCIPFSFEAKNQERLNIWGAIDQAGANAPRDADVAVVIKKNNTKPHVVVTWDCFLRLICPPAASTPVCTKGQLEQMALQLQRIAAGMMDDQ